MYLTVKIKYKNGNGGEEINPLVSINEHGSGVVIDNGLREYFYEIDDIDSISIEKVKEDDDK